MKNKLGIITIAILTIALVAGMILVNRNQDTRRSAAFAEAKVFLLPSEKIEREVGDKFTVQLWVDPGDRYDGTGKAKVQNIQTIICYGPELALDTSSEAKGVKETEANGFDDVALAKVNVVDGKNCLSLAIVADNFDRIKSETMEMGKIYFSAVSEGEDLITINKDKTVISGENSADSLDKYISVGTVTGTSYIVGGGGDDPIVTQPPISGDWPVLNFKMAFRDVVPEMKCAVNNKNYVNVIALGPDGSRKSYDQIPVRITNEKNSKGAAVFEGYVELEGFAFKDNVAVFLKGPRDLQWKYGNNNQNSFYDKAGGELKGLTNQAGEMIFDFSEFPVIPGDVTGLTAGVQDGKIDGLDYAFIKNNAVNRVNVSEGKFLATDLDGDCWTVSRDVNSLLLSIKEKQEQLY
jgi:hypothetical protein